MKKAIYILFVINLLIMNNLFAQKDGELVDVVQQPATFPGGTKGVIKFINDNLEYPKSALRNNIQGTVYIKFIVDKDGSIMKDCVKVARSIDPELDAEALRVVRMMPNWTPAMQNERPVKQRKRVPVKFQFSTNMGSTYSQASTIFENQIKGGWTIQKMLSSNSKKAPKANEISVLQKGAKYYFFVYRNIYGYILSIVIHFNDGTSFGGVSLTNPNKDGNTGLLNISWEGQTDVKKLKEYGLTNLILIEKRMKAERIIKITIIDEKVKHTTIEKIKDKDKIMTFECVGI